MNDLLCRTPSGVLDQGSTEIQLDCKTLWDQTVYSWDGSVQSHDMYGRYSIWQIFVSSCLCEIQTELWFIWICAFKSSPVTRHHNDTSFIKITDRVLSSKSTGRNWCCTKICKLTSCDKNKTKTPVQSCGLLHNLSTQTIQKRSFV